MPPPGELEERLAGVMLRDERRLRRRLDGARRIADAAARARTLDRLAADVETAERRIERRRLLVPAVTYPEQLPVSQRRADILAALRDAQVVVVAGETGSGKTTQLPKMCLELGYGVRGLIGSTQPRRIAARAVAERVAEELGTPLGEAVGYKVRFTDQSSADTLVKVVTDGMLLAELQNDRTLAQYDALILDEAHERSLTIDFLLGYLKQLLPRRPDLKVVVTSATIDPERFARHFGGAPILEVSGRTYPVEVRYRPLVEERAEPDDEGDDDEPTVRDQTEGIADAVSELCAQGPGDILVFLSGEREIRDTADALKEAVPAETEVLPLYGRLSAAEQHRVFAPHRGRRVVLATNVAETSLTVPGIRYVVDPGTARISRYSSRLKVQRLPIERISQASANQRTGRCGRVADGICIRLYSADDFDGRPAYTEPEILRTNLAAVILQMAALGLGEIAAFPFLDPPDRRAVRDGVALLRELGAFTSDGTDVPRQLTPVGRTLAALPVDPRLGRMVVEADRNGCLPEVLVVAAALSIQDPRERPLDKREAAAEKHRRFADKESDFASYLLLWRYLREQQRALSSSQFRRMCKAEYLHYLRVREWQDLHAQLRQTVKGLGMAVDSGDRDLEQQRAAVTASLLAGLLSHVGLRDPEKQDYLGARGARFAISPGSALFRASPRYVMAAELVETTRLWGRVVARIEPEAAEKLGQHLVKRTYSEPHWEKDRGAVVAYEKVTLYGVPLVASRKVDYGRIDPPLCRELFLRHALVYGEWRTHHDFFARNRALLEDVEELEHRVRRRDLVVDDETLFDFYDQRVPPEVTSTRHFDSWWKQARRRQPDLLTFPRDLLLTEAAGRIDEADYPTTWPDGQLRLDLSYQFEPGADADGVTAHLPLAVLNRVTGAGLDWQVPGLRADLVTALLRSLPKALRRAVVPAPDVARAVLQQVSPADGPLLDVLERELRQRRGIAVGRGDWDLSRVPHHLQVTYRVEDESGRVVGEGKDLDELRRRLVPDLRATLAAVAVDVERRGLQAWNGIELPRRIERARSGQVLVGYPALVDEGNSVAVRVLGTDAEQEAAMWRGTRRLLLLGLASPVRPVVRQLSNSAKLTLSANPHGSVAALLEDCTTCAADRLLTELGGPAWSGDGFQRLLAGMGPRLPGTVLEVVTAVQRVLEASGALDRRIASVRSGTLLPALADIREQLAGLVYPGLVTGTGWTRLPDLVRYLRAADIRLEKLPYAVPRDRQHQETVTRLRQEYDALLADLPPARHGTPELVAIRWMLEELRVSLFAQSLGTPYPISEQRIRRALEQVVP